MISVAQLWLPALLSAVLVFVASSLVHMVLKWHNSDFRPLANEDEVRDAIRKGNPAPGQYTVPHLGSMQEMQNPQVLSKFQEGPVAFLVLRRNGPPAMGPALVQWFLFSIVVSLFVAYLGSRTLPVGAHYLRVFRVAGTISFLAYGAGAIPAAIWMGKPWRSALKDLVDALLYGLVTAGAFGWLWPR